jgi:hypothetical protein
LVVSASETSSTLKRGPFDRLAARAEGEHLVGVDQLSAAEDQRLRMVSTEPGRTPASLATTTRTSDDCVSTAAPVAPTLAAVTLAAPVPIDRQLGASDDSAERRRAWH